MQRRQAPWTNEANEVGGQLSDRQLVFERDDTQSLLQQILEEPDTIATELGMKELPAKLVKLAAEFAAEPNPWERQYRELTPEEQLDFETSHANIPEELRRTFINMNSLGLRTLPYTDAQIARQNAIKAELDSIAGELNLPLERRLAQFAVRDQDYYYMSLLERQAHPAGLLAFMFTERNFAGAPESSSGTGDSDK